ncbi:MAG: CRISPR-associated endonuclease Cas1 [Phycisphaerales bacterium]
MLNEYTYCPRLFHLMQVEGRWADNQFTVEGRVVHRRVDKVDHVLPDPERDESKGGAARSKRDDRDAADTADTAGNDADGGGAATAKPVPTTPNPANPDPGDEPPTITRSVVLGSPAGGLGLTAKLDLVSTAGDEALPVDTKRGRVPNIPERCYEPERVQLMAQGFLLRENGYRCDHGVLYFAGSRTRVDVPFTPELEARTLALLAEAKQAMLATERPLPLVDSPKCNGCSLSGICLPDETLALLDVPRDPAAPEVRRLYPVRDDALPLYVQEQGAVVGKTSESVTVRKGDEILARVGLKDLSHLVLCGNVLVTAQTVHLLCEAGVPIVYLSRGHWFHGVTHGITLRNAFDRSAQFAAAADTGRSLKLAKAIVTAKGLNQRTLLRRNGGSTAERAVNEIADLLTRIDEIASAEALLGIEGSIARHYFSAFGAMLRPRDLSTEWAFDDRNRRPPRDPINAMLSFGYALLTKECTVTLLAEGLDPWWGLFHRPRHGRPSMALDLMEEFRAVVVDSAVLSAINTGMIAASDFARTSAGCMLNDTGRKAFIRAYEARLDQLVTHPTFGYRCSWRSVIRLQARLLARWLRGEVPEYVGMTTR